MDDSDPEKSPSEKNKLLGQIQQLVARGGLSRSELLEAYREGQRSAENKGDALAVRAKPETTDRVSRTFYAVGALIVFLGVGLLVFQHWTALSGLAKVLLTLGLGTVVLSTAVVLEILGLAESILRAFYYLSGLMLPLGLFVTFQVNGFDLYGPGVVTLVFGSLFLIYLALFQWFDRTVLLACAIAFGSGFYFGVTEWIIAPGERISRVRFYLYRTLFISMAWMMLARMTSGAKRPVLNRFLWGIGNLGFLSAGFGLGGWEPGRFIAWELLFPFMVLLIFGVSLRMRSRVSLVFSSLFLIAYLSRLTMKYFHDSFGWPLALVLLGFGVMSIGSVTYLVYDRLMPDAGG